MIRVLYFGVARDRAGVSTDEIAPVAETVDAVWDELAKLRPGLVEIRGICRVAVDLSYATGATRVQDGSEVAIIPPVAGG